MSIVPIATPAPPPPPPPPPVEKIAGDNRTDWQIGWGVGWLSGYVQGARDHQFLPSLKRWWASKTIWFSKALIAVGAWVEWLHLSQPVVRDALGEYGGLAIILIGLVTFLLRMSTSGKIGK